MKPIISLSPHVHGGDSVQKNMYGVCIALVPALVASLYFFGVGSAIVLATSVAACVLFEWAITRFILGREKLTICDGDGVRHDCAVESIDSESVTVSVKSSRPCENEPDRQVTLYQALTKGEKMEFIIQKAVELGASEIVPVLSARCVSRPDEKSMKKKLERWNKIALQAAMQSRRGIVPKVVPLLTFEQAAKSAGSSAVICYELGGCPIGEAPQQAD